jgi:plastocyanin
MPGRISRRALALTAGAALLFSAGFGLAQQATSASSSDVVIDDFAFTPQSLTVPAGTKVTWVNQDEEPHTVVSVDEAAAFKSPALDTKDRFSHVFDKPGIYKYFCSIHSHMTGTVVVK